MNREKRKSKGMLGRLFLRNFFIIIIPLLFACTILLLIEKNFTQWKVMENEKRLIMQYQINVDSVLNTFSSTAEQISIDDKVIPLRWEKGNYDTISAMKQLNVYFALNNSMNDIYICVKDTDKIYRKTGILNIDLCINQFILDIAGSKQEDLYELANSMENFGFLVLDGKEKGIRQDVTFISCSLGAPTSWGTLLGIIDNGFFRENLMESDLASETIVFNNKGDILFMTREDLAQIPQEILGQIELQDSKNEVLVMDEDKYIVRYICSEFNGLYYLRMVDIDALNQKWLEEFAIFIVMLIIFCVLLAALLSWTIALYSYMPIKNLLYLFYNADVEEQRDEVRVIKNCIIELQNSNIEMKKELQNKELLQLKGLIIDLVYGNGVFSEEDNELLQKYEITADNNEFAILALEQQVKNGCDELLIKSKLTSIGNHNFIFITAEDAKRYILLYCGYRHADEFMDKVMDLYRDLCESGVMMRIGVGNQRSSLQNIQDSFLEAIFSLNTEKEEDVVFYKSLTYIYQKDDFIVPSNEECIFQMAVKKGNLESALKYSELLKRYWEVNQGTYRKQEIRYVTYRFIGYLRELPIVDIDELAEVTRKLLNTNDITEFFDCYRSFLEDALQKQLNVDNKTDGKIQKILEFIDQNVCDSRMSLTYVAQKFDLREDYLSSYFKTKTGINYREYVSEKRLEESCRLLLETEKSVKEIVETIGYIDVPSFLRKFEKKYGLKVNDYRKINK